MQLAVVVCGNCKPERDLVVVPDDPKGREELVRSLWREAYEQIPEDGYCADGEIIVYHEPNDFGDITAEGPGGASLYLTFVNVPLAAPLSRPQQSQLLQQLRAMIIQDQA